MKKTKFSINKVENSCYKESKYYSYKSINKDFLFNFIHFIFYLAWSKNLPGQEKTFLTSKYNDFNFGKYRNFMIIKKKENSLL